MILSRTTQALALSLVVLILVACASDQSDEQVTASQVAPVAEIGASGQEQSLPAATTSPAESEASQPTVASPVVASPAVGVEAVELPAVEPERWAELKAEIRDKFPSVKQLSVPELKAWMDAPRQQPMLLDVREPEEFSVSHLPAARRARDLSAALKALGDTPKDQPVVLYCSVGYRSSQLAEQLEQQGYSQVFNLEGSIFEWANQGQPVYSDNAPVPLVHPYNSDWGKLLRHDLWSPILGDD